MADNTALATELFEELKELVAERTFFQDDDLDGHYNYLSGCIDARSVIIGRLGYAHLLEGIELDE